MKISLLVTCIAFATTCYSQNFIVKTDGSIVAYKKMKRTNGLAKLTTDKKQELSIREEDVFADYEGNKQRLLYKKPVVELNERTLEPKKEGAYQYLLKVEPGKINLYRDEVYSSFRTGGMTYSDVTFYYYAEKDGEFRNILITGLNSKKDDLLDFKSFFGDDAKILGEIESKDFVYNEKNMLKVIRDYNQKYFKAPSTVDYQKTGAIGIYTLAEGKRKEAIILRVNDSLEYKMPANYFPLSIRLPLDKASKVCVTWMMELPASWFNQSCLTPLTI